MSDGPPDEEDLEAFVPSWDQNVADAAVGKTILAGVTYFESGGQTLRSQEQYHGIIVSVDPKVGVHVRCAGAHAGETICLPPHTRVFTRASPGNYTLRSTGEIVTDPDFFTTWSVTPPVKN
ncbi:MAG: hypothetical protein JO273_10780 [Methylobacteriaceae bacterium]|nr:hypothetical protein [Methylobacteriaceae bacterium]